jgi:hypothetical protein
MEFDGGSPILENEGLIMISSPLLQNDSDQISPDKNNKKQQEIEFFTNL